MWVTGVTLGVSGIADPNGRFHVKAIVEPGIAPQAAKPEINPSSKYVLLVSGLNYGSDNQDSAISRNLLLDLINGHLPVRPIRYLILMLLLEYFSLINRSRCNCWEHHVGTN